MPSFSVEIGLVNFLLRLALDSDTLDFSLPRSSDYRFDPNTFKVKRHFFVVFTP
jgi:hypothetical protein